MNAPKTRGAAVAQRPFVCQPVTLSGMPIINGVALTPRLQGARCQCTMCGDYFASVRAFDRHRVGDYAKPGHWQGTRRCMAQAELDAAGFERNAYGCRREPTRALVATHADIAAPRAPNPMQPPCPTPALPETRVCVSEPTP